MLNITVLGNEFFDEDTQEFVTVGDVVLQLEHSLASLSKWESIWEKPFLGPDTKTTEQVLSYIECMTLTPISSPEIFHRLSKDNLDSINKYIESKQSATWFTDKTAPRGPSREVVTSELIYYWLTVFNIPFECETWHLNRLFTLLKIANIKSQKPSKMSRSEVSARNRELNAQRRSQLGTSG